MVTLLVILAALIVCNFILLKFSVQSIENTTKKSKAKQASLISKDSQEDSKVAKAA